MKEQFTTTVRVAGKGNSKTRAFADALSHVQTTVIKALPPVLLRIEPVDVQVVNALEIVRREAFLFVFLRRERRTYSMRAGCYRERDCHQPQSSGFRHAEIIITKRTKKCS